MHLLEKNNSAGYLEFGKASLRWYLSIHENDLPIEIKKSGQRVFPVININEIDFGFSSGYTNQQTL